MTIIWRTLKLEILRPIQHWGKLLVTPWCQNMEWKCLTWISQFCVFFSFSINNKELVWFYFYQAKSKLKPSFPTLFEWNNTMQEMKFSGYRKVRREVTPGYRERKPDVLGRSTHKASKTLTVLTLLTCFSNASIGAHFNSLNCAYVLYVLHSM